MDSDKDSSDRQSDVNTYGIDDNIHQGGSRPSSAEERLAKSKRIVNIHQFYPNIKLIEDDTRLSLTLIDCVNEEDSEEEEDSRAGSALTDVTDEDEKRLQASAVTPLGVQFLWTAPRTPTTPQPSTLPLGKGDSQDLPTLDEEQDVFSTAVSDETIQTAKDRQTLKPETWTPTKPMLTMSMVINEKLHEHFKRANELAGEQKYETAILCLNRAIKLKPSVIDYYIMRAELFLQLCDYQSAILNYKKVLLIDAENDDYFARLAFIYYIQGQCLFDQRLYPEALESFAQAAEMKPDKVGYSLRSIACLAALNRHGECLALINKRLETEQDNPDLYIMRARLHNMFRNFTLCYYDVKDALALDPEHPEALKMMVELEQKAMQYKYEAMQLNVTRKYREALHKISLAIETNPSVPDYHVVRGAVHRHLCDYNSAIDDYLLALDKTDHNEEDDVYKDSQRQLLLTYNDFAVECFHKGFFDEAIILLNKAIKGEKNEKGLYINRGDCFFKQNEVAFAMADYHQAQELDLTDLTIKNRISIIHNEHGINAYHDKKYEDAESRFTLAIQNNPVVAKYFLSRAKARYMMENSSGARQDILITLLLNPKTEELMALFAQLFPGKSVNEVLSMRAADTARQTINELVATAMPGKIAPILDNKGAARPKIEAPSVNYANSVAGSVWKPGGCFPDIKACMDEREFNVKVAHDKKQIDNKIKENLHVRKSLKFGGGRVQAMPPSVQQETVIRGSSTGWKQYTLGIGVPTNSE